MTTMQQSRSIGTMYGGMRCYEMRRNFLSTGSQITIYENGQLQYQFSLHGRFLGGFDNLMVADASGTPLIGVQKEPGNFFHPTFVMFSADGHRLARITKPFLGYQFEIDTIYGPYRVKLESSSTGSFSVWDAQNRMIASGSTTSATVKKNQNQAFVLALVVVLNRFIRPREPIRFMK